MERNVTYKVDNSNFDIHIEDRPDTIPLTSITITKNGTSSINFTKNEVRQLQEELTHIVTSTQF